MNGSRVCFAFACAASALAVAAALTFAACGRGPVHPIAMPSPGAAGTITFEIFVQGHIAPTEGDYFVAVNADIDANTNVNPNEGPGEPTVQEAQIGTYTHWDQEFIYGFDTQSNPGTFFYAYKAVSGTGGSTSVRFVPILLNPNDYVFVPSASVGGGSGNVMSIQLPISDLSIRANPNGPNPATITDPPAALIYVNYMTTNTTHTPQDQLGCCSLSTTGYQLIVPLTGPATFLSELTTPPDKQGPNNPNLFITGGEIIVNP